MLDIGCGAGKYSTVALGLGAGEVLGIDMSQEMVEAARQAVQSWKAEHRAKAGSESEPGVTAEFMVGSVLQMR